MDREPDFYMILCEALTLPEYEPDRYQAEEIAQGLSQDFPLYDVEIIACYVVEVLPSTEG